MVVNHPQLVSLFETTGARALSRYSSHILTVVYDDMYPILMVVVPVVMEDAITPPTCSDSLRRQAPHSIGRGCFITDSRAAGKSFLNRRREWRALE